MGFLSAFALLLLIVAMFVRGHSISAAIETDSKDMAVLKTLGCTGRNLRFVQVMLYMTGEVEEILITDFVAENLGIGSTDGYIWCYHYILSDSRRIWQF